MSALNTSRQVTSFLITVTLASASYAQTPPEAAGRAWKVLEQAVASTNAETRVRAIDALGLIVKNDRARLLAESRLSDGDAAVRAAAAGTLGQIGLTTSIPGLKSLRGDKDAEVVFAATGSLLRLGDPTAYSVYYAVLTGQRKTGEPLLEQQMKMLKDPGALARIGFEQSIGFIPFGGIGLQVVKGFRQDTVSPVRAAAAQHLARDPDPASGRALAAAAGDEKWLVRASAISAIALRGDRALADAVIPRLDDENEVVRFTAAAAVVRLATDAPQGLPK